MTDLFAESVAAASRTLEHMVARDGSRGIGVGRRAADGSRELVTVVGPGVEPALLSEHPGWDLPLAEVLAIETSSGPRTLIAERLPDGTPASLLADVQPSRGADVPGFAIDLVERVAAEHARDGIVGLLHPATLIVERVGGALAAVAQRSLRVASVLAAEGDRPLLGYAHLGPGDVAGGVQTSADDVFRLAILLWRVRHGAHPFGAQTDAAMLAMLVSIAAGAGADLPRPVDTLDRMLLRCFDPSPASRPTTREILAELGTA